jgi:hypothetical protein
MQRNFPSAMEVTGDPEEISEETEERILGMGACGSACEVPKDGQA